MKKIYKISKWLHKWTSITISVILIWMSISGILLNHPELIENISVPQWMLPNEYDLVNWNRSSIIQAESSQFNNKNIYFCGNEGVFASLDGGYTFTNLSLNGYPNSTYLKRTKSIALVESSDNPYLYAGTYDGLYVLNNTSSWKKLNLPENDSKIVKLVKFGDSLLVASDSHIYVTDIHGQSFAKLPLERIDNNPKMTMIEFFFQLHSGELWGLPGKILFDIGAIILIFLSLSGLYIWLSPKYRHFKHRKNLKVGASHIGWFYRNHLKIGIWSFVILLVFAVTGLFMRPPFIAALLGSDIAYKYLPIPKPTNYWQHRIRNVAFDQSTNKIIIDTRDGYWVSDSGLYGKFSNEIPPVPIFAMGATVLNNDKDGKLLIGSFAGLFRVESSGYYAENVIDKDQPMVSSVRPGASLITGYFTDSDGEEFITTHFNGLQNVNNPYYKTNKYKMPDFLLDNYSMSLWNYLFEIHNGRIFQALIGDYYILFVPLLALIFIIVIVTGVFDWIYLKLIRH